MPLVFPTNPPPPLQSDDGVVLSMELENSTDKVQVVFPMACDLAVPIDPTELCQHALDTFVTHAFPDILASLSDSVSITRVQVESMVKGANIPAEQEWAPGTFVGLIAASDPMPSQCGALIDWYVSPAQHLAGGKQRVGKNTIPGIPTSRVVGDVIVAGLRTTLETFLTNFMNGYADATVPNVWYRVGAAVRTTGQALPLIVAGCVRDYLGTQRKRQLPR